ILAILLALFRLIWLFGKGHDAVALENMALRQQLAIYKRKNNRPRLTGRDRWFWIALAAFGRTGDDARGGARDAKEAVGCGRECRLDNREDDLSAGYDVQRPKVKHKVSTPSSTRVLFQNFKRRHYEATENKKTLPLAVVVHRFGFWFNHVSNQNPGTDRRER